MRLMTHRLICVLALALSIGPTLSEALAAPRSLSAGTRLYLSTDRGVSSRRGDVDVGEIIPCRVWRDVELGGTTFIKGGTPATCRIDKVSRSNMGGVQGKVSIAGVETHAVDGQTVMLTGGYNKEGGGRKAVVWTVGLLLLWPALFVPGGAAELPPGLVFDVSTVNDVRLEGVEPSARPTIHLAGIKTGLSGEFWLDDFVNQAKPETFRLKLAASDTLPSPLMIDSVNGKSIDPVTVNVHDQKTVDGSPEAIGDIKVKALSKYFSKGINRFDVAYQDGGERKAVEVSLDIQF